MSEPIAKCRCGRLFTPMEWAELHPDVVLKGPLTEGEWSTAPSTHRLCPCGLFAVKIQPITLNDVEREYKKALANDDLNLPYRLGEDE